MDRIELSNELARFVSERIASFARECTQDQQWLVPYVEQHRILPLVFGWTETLGITPEGHIRRLASDGEPEAYQGLLAVESRAMAIAVVLAAARRYPQLAAVVPPRLPHAVTCTPCGGTGRLILKGGGDGLICECGGIGWRYIE